MQAAIERRIADVARLALPSTVNSILTMGVKLLIATHLHVDAAFSYNPALS